MSMDLVQFLVYLVILLLLASGLDPHITPENAALQAPRVAKARGLSLDKVTQLIKDNTDPADLGFLGDPGVNVLRLNLALDALTHG